MITDLRAKLASILGVDPEPRGNFDSRLIAGARIARRERDTYRQPAQLRPPVEKT